MVQRLLYLAIPLALLSCGCATPLGPGYTIERQQVDVHFAASSPPHVGVRAIYRLINTGNQPLSSLDVELPPAGANLRVQVNGLPVAPQSLPEAQGRRLQVPLGSPWPQKEERELTIEYDLVAQGGGPEAFVEKEMFCLPRGWHSILLAPPGFFSKGGNAPKKWNVFVRVPEGFLTHASGRLRGSHKQDGEVTYRFEQRAGDFNPFVIAGRYHEQRVANADGTAIFWTLLPLNAADAQKAAAHIAATVKMFETKFAPRDKKPRPVWIVECRAEGQPASETTSPAYAACPALPEVAMIRGAALRAGVAHEETLYATDLSLAYTWFGYLVASRLEQEPLPTDALAHYAALLARTAREGEAARTNRAAELLRNYDALSVQGTEKAVSLIRLTDPPWLLSVGYAKSEMFLMALEDRIGREVMRRALQRLTQALRGSTLGYAELLSAAEAESGQNLGELFRIWLNQTGIPEDFRQRYGAGAEIRK